MNVKELKSNIESKNIGDSPIIMVCDKSNFIANQYAMEIARIHNMPIEYVENISSLKNTSCDFFGMSNDCTYVHKADKYCEKESIDTLKNLIVICNSIDSSVASMVRDFVVEIPEIEGWQILDYMRYKCNGMEDEELKWLQSIANNDIYRIDNELEKIALFTPAIQSKVFRQLNEDGCYGDLSASTIFNLSNAIINRDKNAIRDILEEISNIDVEPMGLVTILHNNVKNLINIQMGVHPTPESLGLTQKQFNAISHNCGKIPNGKLARMLHFLTSIDFRLKDGLLPFNNEEFISYIICEVL